MKSRSAAIPADDYLKLVLAHPLCAIRTRAQFKAAAGMLDRLSIVDEDKLTPGQAAYLGALSDLVESYEARLDPLPGLHGDCSDGIDILVALLEAEGLTASDLGQMLGNRALGGKVLRRERELSKSHLRVLSERFGIPADFLLRTRGT